MAASDDIGAPIRIRARSKGPVTEVMVLMPHPMESGFRRGADGVPVAARYIDKVHVSVGGRTVFAAELGPGMSRDPLFSFRFEGGREGETISVTWTDTGGAWRTDTTEIR